MAEKERTLAVSDRKSLHTKGVLRSLVAGAIAGAVAKSTIAPLDRTKIYFQVTNKRYRFRHAFKFIRKTYTNDGFSTLWRGNSATMARVVPFAALQFTFYEQYKILLRPAGSKESVLPSGRRFIAGSLAGATATALTYPLDMVRARMAVTKASAHRSLTDTFSHIYKVHGVITLYRGLIPTLLGVFPYAGSSFYTYETLKETYRRHYNESPPHLIRIGAGAIAGLVGQSFSYPLDIVRRRMQTEGVLSQVEYRSINKTLRYVFGTEGLRGIFKGVSMNWIKGPLAVTISFNIYEAVQKILSNYLR